MKWLIPIVLMMSLGGCLSNVSLSDLATGAGGVTGAAAGSAVGLPLGGIALTTAAGATAGAVLVDEPETTVDVLEAIPEKDRAKALKNQQIWEAIEHIGIWAVVAVFLFFMIPLIIGYFIPRGSERKYKKEMIMMKEKLFDDPNYTMKDLK